jgi:transglutaminase-like putative cysteine protease
MIVSVFTLAAPHLGRIPPWVVAVYVVAAVWRIMVYRGIWSFPGRLLKLVLIVGAGAATYASFGTLIGLEPTVALLLTAFAFKLIELASRKDAYVLLFLGYFICLTAFLFDQSPPMGLYALLNVWLVTTALLALHQPGEHRFNWRSARQAGVMLLQSLPLMLVLFLLFPRFGPLWKVPMKTQSAKTGVSDFMRPGDISDLGQSDEVAFRAQFAGPIPNTAALYWRGLVFSKLEQGTWRSLRYREIPTGQHRPRPVTLTGPSTDYSIIMEPTQQNWLYSLRYARPLSSGLLETADYRLHNLVEIEDEYQYRVRSWPQVKLEPELPEWRRQLESSLPGADNPRTRALAAKFRAEEGDDRDLVRAALRMFRTEPYVYTLQPPRLEGDNRADQFLFDTRKGFCEHFASSFVVLMRAAGVPARVVAGYQGGEVNPVNRTVIVHQFDAHAWAEVWLAGEGWVRVDPTAQVAPDRIEWGLEQAMSREGSFLARSPLSPLRFRGVGWLNNVRLRYDALTFQWQKWVIGFNREQQFEFVQRYLGGANARTFALVILGSFAAVLVPVAALLLLRRPTHRLRALDRDYLIFCDRLARRGVSREPGETPSQFAERAAGLLPAYEARIHQVNRMYNQLAYSEGLDALRRRQLQRDFRHAARTVGRREARRMF